VGVVLVLLVVAGCTSRMQRLDAEVEAMIAERQATAFGRDAANDPDPGVARPIDDADPRVYAQDPATTNPAAAELPVEPAAADGVATDLDAIPTVLDPDTDAVRLDLEGLLGYAIANSPDYRSEKESLFLAALGLIIERHLWGPRFFDTVAARIDGTPESGDYDTSLTLVNEFSITQRLPYGGSVSASALVDYVNLLRRSSTAVDPEEQQGGELSAAIDLPLLRGAGKVAREDLIQAERDLIYAARDFERFRREFFVEIANTYFSLLRQQQQIKNQEVQLKNLERLAARFQALADAGKEPQFEAERSSQQVLFGRSNLLSQRESYAASLDAFKLRIGMPTTQNLTIAPQLIDVPEPALNMPDSIAAAHRYRLDLQTQRDTVEDATRDVRVAKNNLLPDLDLAAAVTLPTDSDKQRAGFDLDAGEGSYSASATLDLPLDRRIEYAQYRSSLIDLERARRAYSVETDRVSLQVRRSIRRIRQAKYDLALQEKNVELSERRATGVRLRERTLGPRDVIEAQEDLLDARNRRDQAVAELRQSFLQYLLDTGQMRVGADGRWLAPGRLRDAPADPDLPPRMPDPEPEPENEPDLPEPDAPVSRQDHAAPAAGDA
jgi:outer membrane protein TolC